MTQYVEPTTIPDALRVAADHIENNGWYNIAHEERSTSKDGCCAVTALVHVLPWNVFLRLYAVEALAMAVDTPRDRLYADGLAVGKWNDEQMTPEPVIAKMREVADSLEQLE